MTSEKKIVMSPAVENAVQAVSVNNQHTILLIHPITGTSIRFPAINFAEARDNANFIRTMIMSFVADMVTAMVDGVVTVETKAILPETSLPEVMEVAEGIEAPVTTVSDEDGDSLGEEQMG